MMDLSVLRTLYRYELKMLARDKRALMIAVVAPLVIFPAAIWITKEAEARETRTLETMTFRYAVTGSEAEWARPLVEAAAALPADTTTGVRVRPAVFQEVSSGGRPDSLLEAGAVQVVVEALSAEEWRALEEEEARQASEGAERRSDSAAAGRGAPARAALLADRAAVPVVRLLYRESSDRSDAAASRLRERLLLVRKQLRERALASHGFPVTPDSVAPVEAENVATVQREGGALLGRFLTLFLVMLMLTGGSIVAVDAIAGEKERGTLENLLTTAARRVEIVASKQLAVITVGVAITVINVANLLLYLTAGLFEVPASLAAVTVGPAGLLVLLLLFLPLAVLVSSALLLLSGYSKSYKEYQIYFFPVFLLFLLPSAAGLLPGMDLRSLVVLVPLANVSVAVREVLVGEYDWPFLALAFITTTAAAVWGARVTARALSTERLITASELDLADLFGGPELFPRRVLRWFAVLWVILLITSLWLGEELGIRGQVAVNLLGIFLGGSLLMIRRYRLPIRETLALRRPHPAAWLAVLLGAPGALLTGIGLAELLDVIMPVPPEMLEAFGQFLLPEHLSVWQILFFLAILPGICEEIAFRGVLFHGLHRRLSPVALVVATGLIFGMFHVSLFRIGPTAYLGMVLASVVLLTGSLYPAIVWHALNNAIALVAGHYDVWQGEAPPGSVYPVAVAALVLAFWILWRTRRPYPGVGSRQRLRGRVRGGGRPRTEALQEVGRAGPSITSVR